MRKPLLIIGENTVIAQADAALDALRKEADEITEKLSKEFKAKAKIQWELIEIELKMKGLIPEDYQDEGDLMLSVKEGVIFLEEKKDTKRLLEMMNEKIKELMND